MTRKREVTSVLYYYHIQTIWQKSTEDSQRAKSISRHVNTYFAVWLARMIRKMVTSTHTAHA